MICKQEYQFLALYICISQYSHNTIVREYAEKYNYR